MSVECPESSGQVVLPEELEVGQLCSANTECVTDAATACFTKRPGRAAAGLDIRALVVAHQMGSMGALGTHERM